MKEEKRTSGVIATMGSLFDGIGGFPLAASLYGIEAIWASEIAAAAISVTRRHFPGMAHLGDITGLDGGKIEPADIITFGSPCQSFSVAGPRTGLEGKSGMFWEAIRIIREMREATNEQYPRYCVFENVPGILSANGGRDYKAVLEAFAETEIPMPPSGKWANAGMVRGGRIDVAWVIHDAQYFGVAQRRRRLFAVCDFTGQRAAEILFKPKGLRRHFAQGGKAREGTATAPQGRIDKPEPGGMGGAACPPHACLPEIAGTLCASGAGTSRPAGMASETDLLIVAETPQAPLRDGPAYCLAGNMIGRGDKNGPRGDGVNEEISFTLNASDKHCVAAVDCRNMRETMEISGTLQAKSTGGYSLGCQNPVRMGHAVRRLTPTECERLQGYPDGWTERGHDGKPISDTARYQALGNSVAIPCVAYVMSGIADEFSGKGR